jgi:hypothetical protein
MGNMTISVPSGLKSRMDCFAEINWSAVAREAFDEKVKDLELIRKFKEKSTMTEEDAIKLGKELNQRLAKRRK